MTAAAARDVCIRINQEVFQEGRTKLLDELVTDDFINHAAPPDAQGGRAALAGTVNWLRSVFSDTRYEIHRAVAEGDHVALHATMRARHTGEMFGRPATGRPVEMDQMHFFRLAEDGRVAEHWAVRDDAALMRQLADA